MAYEVKPLFKIKQVAPKVFHVSMENGFDLGMTFLRYQEYYESASPDFYRQNFRIVDFMSWYTHERKKSYFTYPIDWSGYNIPGWVIEKVWGHRIYYSDCNGYDRTMEMIVQAIKENWGIKDYNFYLIGTRTENAEATLLHEIAHGLYSTNQAYKAEMQELILNVPEDVKTKVYSWLGSIGYNSDVFDDELQAYFAAREKSSCANMLIEKKGQEEVLFLEDLFRCFTEVLNKYYKKDIFDLSVDDDVETQKVARENFLKEAKEK